MLVSSQNCIRDASLRIVPFFLCAGEGKAEVLSPRLVRAFSVQTVFCVYFLNRYVIPYVGMITLVSLGSNNASLPRLCPVSRWDGRH